MYLGVENIGISATDADVNAWRSKQSFAGVNLVFWKT